VSKIWKISCPWRLISLGKGFFEFTFGSIEDLRLVWSQGKVNMKLVLVRLLKSTTDFNTHSQRQTHAQVWTRLIELPQEYWNDQVRTKLLFYF